jgi:O-antigen/teichoic acid export membrane protein
MVGLVINMFYTRLLVPDIKISRTLAHWAKVRELIAAGIWNSISRLAQVLSDGLDLIITNLWISPYLMGELSIAQQMPTYISTLLNLLINLFSPNLTEYFAKEDKEALVKEVKVSMKFSGFFANIIFCVMVVFGHYFVQLWVPNQDVDLIYQLLILILMSLFVSGVTTSLNNVFLVTNKLKMNSLFWLVVGFANVLIVFILLNLTNLGVYAVAGVSHATGILGNLIFVPLCACRCLKVKWNTFYPIIFRYMGTTVVMALVFWGLRTIYPFSINWGTFILLCILAGCAGVLVNFAILFNQNERTRMIALVKKKILRM